MPSTLGIVASGLSTPLEFSPMLWLDAADTSTITESNGSVSQWDDKSGNGYNASQATGVNQPSTGTRTLNALNVLDFSVGENLANTLFSVTQPNTIFLVGGIDDATGRFYFYEGSISRQFVGSVFSNFRFFAGSSITFGSTDTSPHIFRTIFDGAASSMTLDSTTTVAANAGNNGLSGLLIAKSGNFGLDGSIAEIIVIDRILTGSEIATIEGYLASKWGL